MVPTACFNSTHTTALPPPLSLFSASLTHHMSRLALVSGYFTPIVAASVAKET
eukprot:COSAG06_NODE_6951_length_2702_cov_8.140223_2_plen_52_part_01